MIITNPAKFFENVLAEAQRLSARGEHERVARLMSRAQSCLDNREYEAERLLIYG
jgi:hypothetical protein